MRFFRSTSLVLPLAFLGVIACGSSESEGEGALLPAPTDPVVYDATADTARDVGIVKWGSADDGNTFRGYGRRNELVVEIKQTITEVDDFNRTFELVMTGAASGRERIDIEARFTADNETMEYVSTTRENAFTEGSTAAKILARLEPDSVAMVQAAQKEQSGSLTTKSIQPMDQGTDGGLVAPDKDPLLLCCSELTKEAVALNSVPGGACALATPTNIPIVDNGVAPKAIVLGKDGKPVVKSPWDGKYNIVDHHCHNAAAENASKTDGYIGCHAKSSTTTTSGHTISWGPDPSAKAGSTDAFCAYEPQSNGGTAPKSVCCWKGTASKEGAPLIESKEAKDCVTKLCLGQADFSGKTPPTAFPPGSKPPLPNDCPGSTATQAACGTCCTDQAKLVSEKFANDDAGKKKWGTSIEEYRGRCAKGCLEREVGRQIKSAADKCAKAISDALSSKSSAKNSCSADVKPGSGATTPKK